MMGFLATVWAIGVAVYQFIYQYFAEHYLKEAKQMADEREQGKHIEETKRKDMRRRLFQNAFVYVTYVFAGIFSAFMIGVGTLALLKATLHTSRWQGGSSRQHSPFSLVCSRSRFLLLRGRSPGSSSQSAPRRKTARKRRAAHLDKHGAAVEGCFWWRA